MPRACLAGRAAGREGHLQPHYYPLKYLDHYIEEGAVTII